MIDGFAGNDTLRGGGGNDTVSGGDGHDLLFGDDGNDALFGGAGRDTLLGGNGDDFFYVGHNEGFDWINGGSGYDVLVGMPGSYPGSSYTVQLDYLSVEAIHNPSPTAKLNLSVSGLVNIADTVMTDDGGGFGSITGGAGDDHIYASHLDDTILGGAGDDHVSGGKGDDILYGGTGADIFVFYADDGVDTVIDYDDGVDQIRIFAPEAVTGFADVAVAASGSGARLDFAGTVVLLPGVDPSFINASDFIF